MVGKRFQKNNMQVHRTSFMVGKIIKKNMQVLRTYFMVRKIIKKNT